MASTEMQRLTHLETAMCPFQKKKKKRHLKHAYYLISDFLAGPTLYQMII